MTFVHGKGAVVLMDQYDVSAYLKSTYWTADRDLPDTTTLGNSGKRRQVSGLKDGSISFAGLHDSGAGATYPVLVAALSAASGNVVTDFPEAGATAATTIGKPARLVSAREKTFKSGSPVDGVVPANADFSADGGVDFGVSLHALAAETATGDSARVDQVASANGGVGHIHATASAGTPTLDAIIQHSDDHITWLDLITFAQLTGVGKERKEVVAGTAVKMYIRETHTIGGGTPSITYAVAFARR